MNLHGPLITPETLRATLGDPDLRVVDVRWYLGKAGAGRTAYEHGHLPGAIFLDLAADLAAPRGPGRHPLPDPAAFARRLAAVGIGTRSDVVVYDDAGGGVAARLWWMLDALGHGSVAVLDGGIGGWTAAGGELVAEASSYPPAELRLADAWPRTIDRDALRAALGRVRLLDVRAPERYRGEIEPVDPAAGHIPTALNAPIAGNLGPEGRFLSPEALRARYATLGIADAGAARGAGAAADQPGPVVVSCGSGANACQAALAMRVAGLTDPLLYPGSFSDWSRAGERIAVGPEPGSP